MISIIVSSYNEQYFKQFSQNVADTIGVAYEIIQVNNPRLMGICEAYNRGAALAKYQYLCFSHEDLLFEVNDWGSNLINHFIQTPNLGLIGLAGSLYKPFVPSGWGSNWGGDVGFMNIKQGSKKEIGFKNIALNYGKENIDIVSVDGCFMCTTNEVYNAIKFDQLTFSLYHFYDLDFSMRVAEKYAVKIAFDIPITHFSEGGYDKSWVDEGVKFHSKWKNKLPFCKSQLTKKYKSYLETGAFYFLLGVAMQNSYGYSLVSKINFSKKFISIVGVKSWLWIQLKLPSNFYSHYLAMRKIKATR